MPSTRIDGYLIETDPDGQTVWIAKGDLCTPVSSLAGAVYLERWAGTVTLGRLMAWAQAQGFLLA